MIGFEDCESLVAGLKRRAAAGRCSVRHFSVNQQSSEMEELGNAYGLPEMGNPAGGLTDVKRDMPPLLRSMEAGAYKPEILQPLRGISPSAGVG